MSNQNLNKLIKLVLKPEFRDVPINYGNEYMGDLVLVNAEMYINRRSWYLDEKDEQKAYLRCVLVEEGAHYQHSKTFQIIEHTPDENIITIDPIDLKMTVQVESYALTVHPIISKFTFATT